ncbi:helix-turn-helix domain-containing protein [Cohnella rhizosphaerae]
MECFRIAEYAGNRPLEVKVCPSGYPGMVYQMAADRTAAIDMIAIRSGQAADLPALFLHGQGSEPSIMRFKAKPYTTIQVVFKPHALYSLFGWDAGGHLQRLLFPGQFGASELERALVEAASNEERLGLLHRFLAGKLELSGRRDELVERSLRMIREQIGTIAVQDLTTSLSISERQFQKRFARVVGMPPHLFIRVRRVNEALRMMHSGQYERLADVAYALNYYDQSHFIRDMKLFSWVSPKHIAMKVSEFHHDLAGSSYL